MSVLLAPTSWSPALKVRVAVTGRIATVTVIGVSSTATMPLGKASSTRAVTSSETPASETGSVSTAANASRSLASPATRATCGVTVTDSISKPAAGVPVTIGLTGSVFCWRSEMTGIDTCAVAGVTSTGITALPSLSIGTSRTSSLTSIPPDWIATSARTESTWETSDAAGDRHGLGIDGDLAERQLVRDGTVDDLDRDIGS